MFCGLLHYARNLGENPEQGRCCDNPMQLSLVEKTVTEKLGRPRDLRLRV